MWSGLDVEFRKKPEGTKQFSKTLFYRAKREKRDKKTQKLRSIFLNDMKLKNDNCIMRERNSFESFWFEHMKKNKNVHYFRRREYRF